MKNLIWLLDVDESTKTYIWTKKKQKPQRGPTLPESLKRQSHFPPCSTSINATHVFIAGFHVRNKRNAIIDFATQNWVEVAPLTYEGNFQGCQATIIFDKMRLQSTRAAQPTIVIHLQSLLETEFFGFYKDIIQTYDFLKNQWSLFNIKSTITSFARVNAMISMQGKACSIMEDGTLIEHRIEEKDQSTIKISSINETVSNAILFFAWNIWVTLYSPLWIAVASEFIWQRCQLLFTCGEHVWWSPRVSSMEVWFTFFKEPPKRLQVLNQRVKKLKIPRKE